jgi:elongation factor Ts
VANSKDFARFVHNAKHKLYDSTVANLPFNVSDVESERKEIVATTKENVVVRRWWAEQAMDATAKVFAYQHSNNKIGVLLTLKASDVTVANSPEFKNLGEELAMQVAAMNPVAVSSDRIPLDEDHRQRVIFQTQLDEMNKPVAQQFKIMEGKMRKWHTEVCLLEQESVVVAKTTVKQVLANFSKQVGSEVQVVNFVRCQVGEGIETIKEDLANEVAKLTSK